MSHLRSKEMHLYKLCVSKDHVWQITKMLGDHGVAHFIDLNDGIPPFQLSFTPQVQQCKIIENKITELEHLIAKYNI